MNDTPSLCVREDSSTQESELARVGRQCDFDNCEWKAQRFMWSEIPLYFSWMTLNS